MEPVAKSKAEIAWLIYDLDLVTEEGRDRYKLTKIDEVFTEFTPALKSITTPVPGDVHDFVKTLQDKLDEQLETPPTNSTIERPLNEISQATTASARILRQKLIAPETSQCCLRAAKKPLSLSRWKNMVCSCISRLDQEPFPHA